MIAARRRRFAGVKSWRADDRHTGIEKHGGIPNTYEHVKSLRVPGAEVHRVECYIPFVKPTPLHRNVYYVPAHRLDVVLHDRGEIAEMTIDIRR
jgi:hypothetical protein